MTPHEQYLHRLTYWSDILGHLPRLYEMAKGNVLELGVRDGNSTAALLAGVAERGGHLWSVDIADYSKAVKPHPQWTFIRADSLDVGRITGAGVPSELDLLFIDTDHTYERTLAELTTWGARVKRGGAIVLHDTDNADFPDVRKAIEAYEKAVDGITQTRFIDDFFGLGVLYK